MSESFGEAMQRLLTLTLPTDEEWRTFTQSFLKWLEWIEKETAHKELRRANKRECRQHRAAFRRRKRGLA